MNEEELKALRQFADGLLGIFALPDCHPSDRVDIAFHVHAIQNIVMARAAARAHPDEFTTIEGFR